MNNNFSDRVEQIKKQLDFQSSENKIFLDRFLTDYRDAQLLTQAVESLGHANNTDHVKNPTFEIIEQNYLIELLQELVEIKKTKGEEVAVEYLKKQKCRINGSGYWPTLRIIIYIGLAIGFVSYMMSRYN